MRNVVIHYHIFKNAGSSIDKILIDNYGSAWAPLEGSTPTSLLTVHDIERFLLATRGYQGSPFLSCPAAVTECSKCISHRLPA